MSYREVARERTQFLITHLQISAIQLSTHVTRRDRNNHGGGVFIIAKDEINITEIDIANTDCPLVLAKIMVKDELMKQT